MVPPRLVNAHPQIIDFAESLDASSRLEAYKRAAASRPARDAVYSGNGFATTLERTPFEYRPDTPDAMTFSEYSR